MKGKYYSSFIPSGGIPCLISRVSSYKEAGRVKSSSAKSKEGAKSHHYIPGTITHQWNSQHKGDRSAKEPARE